MRVRDLGYPPYGLAELEALEMLLEDAPGWLTYTDKDGNLTSWRK